MNARVAACRGVAAGAAGRRCPCATTSTAHRDAPTAARSAERQNAREKGRVISTRIISVLHWATAHLIQAPAHQIHRLFITKSRRSTKNFLYEALFVSF